jgi:hypothetical protein
LVIVGSYFFGLSITGSGSGFGLDLKSPSAFMVSYHTLHCLFISVSVVLLIITFTKENLTNLTNAYQPKMHLSGAFGELSANVAVNTRNVSALGASRFSDSASIMTQSLVYLTFL